MKKVKNPIIEGIENLLKRMKLTEEDFKGGKLGRPRGAHKKVTDEILKKWRETGGFGLATVAYAPRGGTYGIDVIGRSSERGRILMSVEVDTGHRPYGSWMKLLDIRSDNKIWIYITAHPRERAKENFEESVREIKDLINSRREEKSVLGNFVAFVKTPSFFDKKIIYPPEAE